MSPYDNTAPTLRHSQRVGELMAQTICELAAERCDTTDQTDDYKEVNPSNQPQLPAA